MAISGSLPPCHIHPVSVPSATLEHACLDIWSVIPLALKALQTPTPVTGVKRMLLAGKGEVPLWARAQTLACHVLIEYYKHPYFAAFSPFVGFPFSIFGGCHL